MTTLKFSYIYQFKLFQYYFSSCLTLWPQTVHLAYRYYLLQVRASRERIEEAQSDSEDDDDADIFHMVSLHSSLASHVVFLKSLELHSLGCLYYLSLSIFYFNILRVIHVDTSVIGNFPNVFEINYFSITELTSCTDLYLLVSQLL